MTYTMRLENLPWDANLYKVESEKGKRKKMLKTMRARRERKKCVAKRKANCRRVRTVVGKLGAE